MDESSIASRATEIGGSLMRVSFARMYGGDLQLTADQVICDYADARGEVGIAA